MPQLQQPLINYPFPIDSIVDEAKRNLFKIRDKVKSARSERRDIYFHETGIDIFDEDTLVEMLEIVSNRDHKGFDSLCNTLYSSIDDKIEEDLFQKSNYCEVCEHESGCHHIYREDSYSANGVRLSDFGG